MAAKWRQDKADYSWLLTDDAGCTFRVGRVYTDDGQTFWALGWIGDYTGSPHVGAGLHRTLAEAKRAVRRLAHVEKVAA